jgi:hypothetical protein
MKKAFLILTVALLLIPARAIAHHGWAAFLSGPEMTLRGTVKDFHFVNPHSVVEFEVRDEKGKLQVWEGELGSRSNLLPRGWTPASVEIGEKITISGYPARNGSYALRVTKIVLSNGKELKPGGGN